MAPGNTQRGVPPVVSPRTSSSRNIAAAQGPVATTERGGSRRREHNDPSGVPGDGQQEREGRQRSNGNGQANGASRDLSYDDAAARAGKRAPQSPADPQASRPSGSREPRTSRSASAIPGQPHASTSQTPSGHSKEDVLNRIVFSKPEVDIEREKERMAEAIPLSSPTQTTPNIGSLSPGDSEAATDPSRSGGRSRHEHTPGSSKQKNVKFGEYYLGNTLGEGEFGKVKMGWKQEGGVQVRTTKSLMRSY